MALLEVACFQPAHVMIAHNAGADRIELCDDRNAGGVTPPGDWLGQVKTIVTTIPIFVMIRPRRGDFLYTEAEFERMKAAIDDFKAQADGFVFGVLTPDRQVDVTRTAELVQRAHPLPCTFHRAFDGTRDSLQALEDVIATGCSSILTSGGAASALAGLDTLNQLVRSSRGRITVMAGGGVRAENIAKLRAFTQAMVFHSSAFDVVAEKPSEVEIRRMKALLLVPISVSQPDQVPPSITVDAAEDDSNPLAKSAGFLGNDTLGEESSRPL